MSNSNKNNNSRIIIAMDYNDRKPALELVQKLDPTRVKLKVGKEMFTLYGPDFIHLLVDKGFDIFLDLKYHDIPNQVAGAVRAATQLGVWMMNVHASGGSAMLAQARDAVSSAPIHQKNQKRPLIIGVTILTSLEQQDIAEIGYSGTVEENVLRLATLCSKNGLDGVVCSAQEAVTLKQKLGKNFLLVTPGIRFERDNSSDQKRVMTPRKAVEAGADYLVIGRSITAAADPMEVVAEIEESLEGLAIA